MARPRAFDLDVAIDAALMLFWRRGYEGTSLTDLTEAMGINRPSFYAAFESKEALFARALERYANGPAACMKQALDAPTGRQAVERLLAAYADAAADPERPRGCLLVQGALACSNDARAVQGALSTQRAASETMLRERLRRAKSEGELPANESPTELARYYYSVCLGMAVQSQTGATRAELRHIAARAMRAWPVDVEA